MEFRILGPLEIRSRTQRLELGGARQQIILATLLLNANRLVTMDRLLEATYGEDPPPTARSQAQITISSLRRMFADHGLPSIISTRPHGYAIELGTGWLDSERFEELVTAARKDRDFNRLEQAVAHYRDALRLWRGPALDGIDSLLVQAAARRLDEMRIATTEDVIDLELDLGRHHELVGELTELVAEHPLRERLRSQLMLALYRCDRAAEALQVYQTARRSLIDELGIEPGERLRQLQQAILTSDPSLDPPARPVTIQSAPRKVPCLLPTDIADFTDRVREVSEIRRYLSGSAGDDPHHAVPVVVIVGKGGIGKTSLAVHASHRLAGCFPDGQLFANLHGTTLRPVAPEQVLERFLRALGVPGSQVPDGLEERAETYRALLADRKVLVVLDDAAAEIDVTPLLPGSGAAAVIITSRTRLAGLAGAVHIDVDVFDADHSLRLLARIVGHQRVQAEPEATTAVAELCGRLPLALRIAGARLSARPHWSVQQLAERLADETRRLDELSHGDMGIRANISLSYEAASGPARRLFRLLALLDVPVFSGWVSAALLGQPVTEAADLLDELVSVQLVESTGTGFGVHNQYRFHELVRVFARERLAAEESADERRRALQRALGALLYLAEEAHRRHYGGDYVRLCGDVSRWPLSADLVDQLVRDPLSWFERERVALVSGVRQAAQAGLVELCWSLASTAVTLFESRAYLDNWRETHQIALEAARRSGHTRGRAAMLYSIGSLYITEKKFGLARRDFNAAARLFQDVGDQQGMALVTRHLAYLDRLAGRLDEAARRYEQSLEVFRKTGDRIAEAYVLHGLAQVKLDSRKLDEAGELLAQALELSHAARSVRVEAQVLHRMGDAYLLAGEPERAVRAFELALARVRGIGDAIGEAYVLQGLGIAKARLGKFDQAYSTLENARSLAGTTGERLAEARALLGLGELALNSSDHEHAASLGKQAAEIFRQIGAPLFEARARALLREAQAVPETTTPAGGADPVTAPRRQPR